MVKIIPYLYFYCLYNKGVYDGVFVRFIEQENTDERDYRVGEIRIGDFSENFRASLSYWKTSGYINQWKDGLSRLLAGHENSCIITSMYDPSVAHFIFWWVLYLIDDTIYIQNNLLLLDELDEPFSIRTLYDHIPQRETTDADGNKISEWCVRLGQIREFYRVLLQSEGKFDVS